MALLHHHYHRRPLTSLNLMFRLLPRPNHPHPARNHPSPIKPRHYARTFRPTPLPASQTAAKLLVGTTMATCVGIWLFSVHALTAEPQPAREPDDRFRGADRPQQPQAEARLSRISTPEFVQRNLILTRSNLASGNYWTLLTHTLTHIHILHLLVNMNTLYQFGVPLAQLFGAPAYAAVWVGSGVVGGVAALVAEKTQAGEKEGPGEGLWDERTGTGEMVVARSLREKGYLGASGSIMGMVAVFTCWRPWAGLRVMFLPFNIPAWAFMFLFSGVSVYAQWEGKLSWIGHMSHLGGAAFGALYYLLALRGRKPGLMRVGMR